LAGAILGEERWNVLWVKGERKKQPRTGGQETTPKKGSERAFRKEGGPQMVKVEKQP